MLLVATIVIRPLVVAGPGSSTPPDLLGRLRAEGTLRIAVTGDPPQTTAAGGAVIGFDVDVARELAKSLGLDSEISVVTAADILDRTGGDWDIGLPSRGPPVGPGVAAGPAYYAWPSWLVSDASSAITTAELEGAKICAVSGTAGLAWLRVTDSLVKVAIVVALYVFIGSSGVLSFGHISFVAIGAWTAGVLSIPVAEKPAIMPNLAGFLRDRTVGNVPSLALAALVGGLCALVVALPLMRLSGLAAGIATFAVLEITHNLLRYYEPVGPGLNTFSSVPETTGLGQAALGAVAAVVLAFVYGRSRFGRLLRATREDPAAASAVGVSIYRQRLIAFTLSGVVAGFAGGLYVHLLPLNTETVYLDLTFITLAMLVIGGATSLWGAVVGALAVSALDSFLAEAENGLTVLGRTLDLPAGTRVVVVGALMALVLILRPAGLTGGREFRLPRPRPPRREPAGATTTEAA